MRAPRPFQTIAERIDEAFAEALSQARAPVELVLGKEDYPAFKAWAMETLGLDIEGERYRGVPVRWNEPVYLSRLKLQSKPGVPNALLL